MRFTALVVATALATQPAAAADAPPTEKSIRELFAVMHTSALLDSYVAQIDSTTHATMRAALKGVELNAEQRQIMDDMSSELAELLRHELNWASLEPMLIEGYRKTFSQQEVDGMLTFYRSSIGQAVVTRLPAVTRQAAQAMQSRAATLVPKIAQLQRDTMAALKRAQDRAEGTAAPPPPPAAPPPPESSTPQPP